MVSISYRELPFLDWHMAESMSGGLKPSSVWWGKGADDTPTNSPRYGKAGN
jgi:hypothetical protein